MRFRRADRRKTALRTQHTTRLDTPKRLTVVCAWCKRLKRADGSWVTLAAGVKPSAPGDVVSHGICEDCLRSQKKLPSRGSGRKGPEK
jgi:hypothetical protein